MLVAPALLQDRAAASILTRRCGADLTPAGFVASKSGLSLHTSSSSHLGLRAAYTTRAPAGGRVPHLIAEHRTTGT